MAGTFTVAAGQGGPPASGQPARDPVVTPVVGPSWLNRLGVRYRDTTLGRSAATYGPPPGERPAGAAPIPLAIGRPVVLTGADLYRLNCQSCHRAEGTGSPPEIKSVLGLVQGSSLELVRKQLREQGKASAASAARAQSGKARTALYNRVKRGGERMPPLAHLADADFAALYAYLTQLARTPDATSQSPRTVSWSRLGEHVIKGTCHICHDAVGPRPTNEAVMFGTIPPLTTLLEEKLIVEFLRKVRTGAPVMAGDPAFHYRGRMPVFPYLSDLEVAAAYNFLIAYPPQATATPR
jgi:mono/diheme cytochrome c family protein